MPEIEGASKYPNWLVTDDAGAIATMVSNKIESFTVDLTMVYCLASLSNSWSEQQRD